MERKEIKLEERIERLESRNRQMVSLGIIATAGIAIVIFTGASKAEYEVEDEVKTNRLVVVDDQGTPRVVIGQDPKKTDRVSRACGITIHDKKGTERGGFSTMDDGSVVIGLDAPAGVGSPMRDRIGIKVYSDGHASVWLINNKTGIPVRLISEVDGGGGIEFFDYDLKARKAFIKRIDFDGETSKVESLDEN